MFAALRSDLPPPRLTVAEFLDWAAATPGRWQLRDGVPLAMAPPSDTHGMIQGELRQRLTEHFRATGRPCRATLGAGVVPRVRADRSILVPDIAVTCAGPASGYTVPDPVVLVEVLSPSNENDSRANVWAYTSMPSVQEVLMVYSTAIGGELLRRQADGTWPAVPDMLATDAVLELRSVGFAALLRELYRDTLLAVD